MFYEIVPLTRVGPLQLGMTVDEVRALVPATPRPPRGWSGEHVVDAYETLGLSVFYGKHGACEGLELSTPSMPTLEGRPLLGVAFNAALALLRLYDGAVEIDDQGAISYVLGVALYCPGHREQRTLPVAGVFVFGEPRSRS